jgi:hypothetical protein
MVFGLMLIPGFVRIYAHSWPVFLLNKIKTSFDVNFFMEFIVNGQKWRTDVV